MKTRAIILTALAFLLAACEPTLASRGNVLDPEKLVELKPGESTREEVATKLGTPTEVSTFDDKTWYYVGRQTEQYSFLDPEVIKQQAIEVNFNDDGVVTSIHKLDLSQAEDIDPVDRSTPTYGRSDTLIRQLLGDVARPSMPGRTSNPNTGGPGGGR